MEWAQYNTGLNSKRAIVFNLSKLWGSLQTCPRDSEMQQYAGQLKSHPAYRNFCDKFHLDYDEFIDNILQQAIMQLLHK